METFEGRRMFIHSVVEDFNLYIYLSQLFTYSQFCKFCDCKWQKIKMLIICTINLISDNVSVQFQYNADILLF